MTDIADRFKGLENCLAYQFENNMASIKRSIRGPGKAIVQASRRLAEKEQNHSSTATNPERTKRYQRPRIGSCYRMKNGKYCTIHELGSNNMLCEVYERTQGLYSVPCDSRLIGIHKVSKARTNMEYYDITDVDSTYIPLSLFDIEQSNEAAIVPLMHAL